MSSSKRNIYTYLGKVILITLLIVLFIRCFFIESFTVSSSQMENTLLKGDKLLIDKTAYGVRLPVTLLSIPFTFDNIGGVKSYSSALQMPYTRLFMSQIDKNEIVLFNNPEETDKPLDKRSLLLSRCVGLPGDTIFMQEDSLFVNRELCALSPGGIDEYVVKGVDTEMLKSIASELNIPLRGFLQISDTCFLQLDEYELFMLSENMPDSLAVSLCERDSLKSRDIVIPYKGGSIDINEENLIIYKQVILEEQEGAAVIEKENLLINGVKQKEYVFEDDYYWMLSDNSQHSLDSKSLGFIPFRSVIGKVRFVWYNPDEKSRGNRCFKTIK